MQLRSVTFDRGSCGFVHLAASSGDGPGSIAIRSFMVRRSGDVSARFEAVTTEYPPAFLIFGFKPIACRPGLSSLRRVRGYWKNRRVISVASVSSRSPSSAC